MNNKPIQDYTGTGGNPYIMTKRIEVFSLENSEDIKPLHKHLDDLAKNNFVDFKTLQVRAMSTKTFEITWDEVLPLKKK